MKTRRRIGCALSFALLAMVASTAWAEKNSAAAKFEAPFTGNDVITATIDKGKKKRLLLASASAVIEDGALAGFYCDLSLTLTANGVPMSAVGPNGRHALTTCDCPTSGCNGCSLSAVAYLDLAAAEQAEPGLFVKQPIHVQLRVSTSGSANSCKGGSVSDAATLVVRMIKK